MRYSAYVLLLLGSLTLGSCSKDGASSEPKVEQNRSTIHAKLSLDLAINPDREDIPIVNPNDPASAARAIDERTSKIKVRDGLNKFVIGDDGKNTSTRSKRAHIDMENLHADAANIKFYLQIRKGNTIVAKDYATWEYNSRGKKVWRLNGKNITLTGVTPGTDQLQVRVVAGGKLNVVDNRIEVPAPIYQVVEGDSEVEFPVPYASDWLDLSYDATQGLLLVKDDAQIKLKPLGILLVTTFRRENKGELNGVSLTGVRYVTNSLYFQGYYTLDASDQVPFTSTDEQAKTPTLDDVYYTTTFDFGKRITVNTSPASTMVVAWAASARKTRSIGWNTSDPKNQSDESLHKMFSAAITHVYAEGVLKNGQPFTKPNYNVVPIMGTNVPFRDGTSAAVNTEFSVPEPLWIGYLAKYTVATDGNSFDTSHDDDKVSLVNWKVAREFLKGKTIDGVTYYMGNTGLATTIGHYANVFRTDGGTSPYLTKLTGSSGRVSYVRATNLGYLSWLTFGNKRVGESLSRSMMQVYDPVDQVSYGLFGQDSGAATASRRNRSQATSTSIVRREYAWPAGKGKYPPGRSTLTGISLGKYFIGNIYTPIYKLITGDEAALWTTPEAQINKVQRIIPAPGRYDQATEGELDNREPANTHRTAVHHLPLFWYQAHYTFDKYPGWTRWMYKLAGIAPGAAEYNKTGREWLKDARCFDVVPLSLQKQFLDSPINKIPNPDYVQGQGGNVYYNGTESATLPAIDINYNFMWMALLPYSQTYLGDSAD